MTYIHNECLEPIVKICKVHGNLTIFQVNKTQSRRKPTLRCKECYKNTAKAHYVANRKKILEKQKEDKQSNPEKTREQKYNSWVLNKEKTHQADYDRRKKWHDNNIEKVREYDRIRQKQEVIALSDTYTKKLICKKNNLSYTDIPKPLIQFIRTVKMIKREIAERQDQGKIYKIFKYTGEDDEQK